VGVFHPPVLRLRFELLAREFAALRADFKAFVLHATGDERA